MATLYQVNKNFQGINSFGTNFCSETFVSTLAANTNTTLHVPLNAVMGMAPAQTANNTFIAVFHYEKSTPVDVYVSLNAAATAPTSGTFTATTSVLNPTGKVCKSGDVLNFLCVAGGNVSVEFFSTQEN
jgi:hypothetical protein